MTRPAGLELRVGEPGDRLVAAASASAFAVANGADRRTAREIALCVSELVSNVERYAVGGTVTLRTVGEAGGTVEIVVADRGPGLVDFDRARRDGYSQGRMTLPGEPVGSGRSLGVGLGAVERMMDSVSVEVEPGHGTVVTARRRLGRRSR